MSAETLVPFDLDAYKADPSRLRVYGQTPLRSVVVFGAHVVVQWQEGHYTIHDRFTHLRLAAKREVPV